VKIDLHNLILLNRNAIIEKDYETKTEKGIYYFWKKGMLNREIMNKGGASFKNFLMRNFFKKNWGKNREFPKIASKSFNEIWKEKHQN
jgi:L-lactate dehydrogenase complex protein LldF